MMTRLRFDILIENTIRALPRGSDQLIPLKVADPVAITETRLPAPPLKRTVKTIVRFLLRPLKPIIRPVARYGRRYLVGDIEASLHVLRAQMLSLVESLQTNVPSQLEAIRARQESFEKFVQNALELVQLLHTKADDLGLRSRGLVQIDASTFALRTYDGFVFIPRADNLLLLMLLDAGPAGLEPGTRRILTKLLQPGMTFVDIGAHIGLLTLAGARAVGRTGKVLALEPTPAAFDCLSQAILVNGLAETVKARRQAVGESHEQRQFYVRRVLGHSSLTPSDIPGESSIDEIEVEISPLDGLVEPGERIDLVKIDVEGTELAVLAGMKRIIAENPDIGIIAEFGPSHLRAAKIEPEYWFASFRNNGLEPLVIDELSGKCRVADLRELRQVESVNILFAARNSPFFRFLSLGV
jgi:FkbM family methyltransferase